MRHHKRPHPWAGKGAARGTWKGWKTDRPESVTDTRKLPPEQEEMQRDAWQPYRSVQHLRLDDAVRWDRVAGTRGTPWA